MAQSDGPKNPITTLLEDAIAAHEVYTSFREAGFDHSGALYLTGQCMTGGRGTPPPGVNPNGE